MSNVKQLVHNLIDIGTKSSVVLMPYVWTKQDVEEWFGQEFTDVEWTGIVDKIEMNIDDLTETLFELVREQVDVIRPNRKHEKDALENPYLVNAIATIARLRDENPDIPFTEWGRLMWDVYRAVEQGEDN